MTTLRTDSEGGNVTINPYFSHLSVLLHLQWWQPGSSEVPAPDVLQRERHCH